MVLNGRIPSAQLTRVFPNSLMINSVAVSVKTLVRVAAIEGVHITEAGNYANGYRDLTAQKVYWNAAHGNRAAAIKAQIDPNMKTAVGSVGAQSHGWGDRIDLLFNSMSPSAANIALVERYGGVQEFGDDDNNHMWFKRSVSGPTESDKNRIVAHFLNGKHLGKTTSTADDGSWPQISNFSWLLQEYGTAQKGWYPQPRFKVDGVAGAQTKVVRNKLFTQLWA